MTTLIVGLDGHDSGERALAHARMQAEVMGECEIVLVYVIEWSPFSFQTAEENEQRHKRREEEVSMAKDRVVDPAVTGLKDSGHTVTGRVLHGDVADTINRVAKELKAHQIVVGRASDGGMVKRLFGSSTSNLVMTAAVPVTVVP